MKTRVKTRVKILVLLALNPHLTTTMLASELGITRKGVEWQITLLKSTARIRRIGPANGGHWEILE